MTTTDGNFSVGRFYVVLKLTECIPMNCDRHIRYCQAAACFGGCSSVYVRIENILGKVNSANWAEKI